MNVKGAMGEGSGRNYVSVIRNWRKEGLCYIRADGSAERYTAVLCKAELVSNEPACLAEISKHGAEGAASFLLAAYSKIPGEREKSREELLRGMMWGNLSLFTL